MITDDQTNKVYFSEYLRDYKCWKSIKETLLEHEINFEMLPNTKDIWVRDFMPIQKDVNLSSGMSTIQIISKKNNCTPHMM